MHDILSNVKIEQLLAPQVVDNEALVTPVIDRQGSEALAFAVMVGDVADTLGSSVRIDLQLQHADDDGAGNPGAFQNCGDDDVLGAQGLVNGVFKQINHADDENKRHCLEYRGGKRYVRLSVTPVGLTDGGTIAVAGFKANTSTRPVAN